jgi:hypothetical protein
MKGAYNVLTVVFWIALILSAIVFFINMSRLDHVGLGHVLGALFAAAIIPGILWIIRYFIGKNIGK